MESKFAGRQAARAGTQTSERGVVASPRVTVFGYQDSRIAFHETIGNGDTGIRRAVMASEAAHVQVVPS